ncbi:MAG: hypothetical protein JO307_29030 [Bryobacterales bacterium]|nr:hypothetical protein [Bryobacterales bacterium]
MAVERVYGERDGLTAPSTANFKNVEMAPDQADPDEWAEEASENALDSGGCQVFRRHGEILAQLLPPAVVPSQTPIKA